MSYNWNPLLWDTEQQYVYLFFTLRFKRFHQVGE